MVSRGNVGFIVARDPVSNPSLLYLWFKLVSAIVRSTVAANWPSKLFADDLAPRMHMMHDLNKEKEIRHLSHRIVGCFHFSDNWEASLE